jgi:integrase
VEDLKNSGKLYQSNRVLAVIKAFFNWAKQAGEIQDNPAQNIKRLSEEKPRERVLTGNELVQVLKAASEMGELFGALIKTLILTGQRREEVTQAKWEEFDLTEGTWIIPAVRTKNGQPHEIPLARASVDFLESLPRKSSEFLFPGRFGDKPFNGWSKASQRLLAAANLETPWIIHDLRRTFATGCGELGIDPFIIKRLLNHSMRREMGVTSIYERSHRRDATRMAVEKWTQHVETLTHGQTSKVIRLPA